jgi:AbrB family looped-hinge helix DNA binding protein
LGQGGGGGGWGEQEIKRKGGKQMKAQICKLDEAARITIPRSIKQEFGLKKGDLIEIDSDGEKITVKPVEPKNCPHCGKPIDGKKG